MTDAATSRAAAAVKTAQNVTFRTRSSLYLIGIRELKRGLDALWFKVGVHGSVASIPLVAVDDVLQTDGTCTLLLTKRENLICCHGDGGDLRFVKHRRWRSCCSADVQRRE